MKVRAKYIGNLSEDDLFQDEEFPPMNGKFVKDKIYEFALQGMTVYPIKTPGKIVRYSSIASFLRSWTGVEVLEL